MAEDEGQVPPAPGAVPDGAGGLVARWAFGPVGWLLVAANSYSKSVTGRSLVGHLEGARPEAAGSATSES